MDTNSKHTPGPWRLERSTLLGANDRPVATIIAPTTADTLFQYVRKADAQLIAAAPELLEALLSALPYVEDVLDNPEHLACFKPGTVQRHAKLIREAIAKATAGT